MQLPTLVLIALLSATPVQVRTLDGTLHSGSLTSLESGRLTIDVDGDVLQLDADNLLEVRPENVPQPDEFLLDRSVAIRFVDGSLLHAKSFTLSNRKAAVESDAVGGVSAPLSELRSVRLAEMESPVRDAWDALHERDARTDLLIVRKMDALDFVGGVVSGVDDSGVHLLVNNREVTVPADRVFGLIFPNSAPNNRESACEILLASGDRLILRNVDIQDDNLSGSLHAGAEVSLPLAQVQVVDFGLGRVRYLTDLTETAEYKPVGLITTEDVLRIRKNVNSIGGSFVVGQKAYARGLWVHSGTTLKYRLNRDFRRLQATVGVDRSASGCARVDPQVVATITGDGRQLFQGQFGWDVEPASLDLDVAGVRDLEIRVEPANPETIGACEHLVLAEARVIK